MLERLPFRDDWLAAAKPSADVMDARTRMAMYRSLVERCNPRGVFGEAGELSPFWGYASQLAWQRRSGRLGSGHAIDAASWWGACNYALSVIPYVAAMQLALVPELPIAVPAGYAPALAAWQTAFRSIGDDLDAVRVAIWRAHLASITQAVRMHEAEHHALPAAEQRFARGWIRMVDLFAAAALRTDLVTLVDSGDGALPSRVLAGDAEGELPRPERSTAKRVGALADRPRWRWQLELAVWRRVMRTRPARADSERLLAALLGRGEQVWPARAKAAVYAALPARWLERGMRG